MSNISEYISKVDKFRNRHIGPNAFEINMMLQALGLDSLDSLCEKTVPNSIRTKTGLRLDKELSEVDALKAIRTIASKNKVYKSWIGMGYSGTVTPPVIQRNILENPGWYTQYTPYQAEISQGRMESLLNFQTMVTELTGLPIANASLLDEATACAEAMNLCHSENNKKGDKFFFVDQNCHPQTLDVVITRANALGVKTLVGDFKSMDMKASIFGVLIQYPDTNGNVNEIENFIKNCEQNKIMTAISADILALTVLKAPGKMGADIVAGNTQRFGVPLGYGGPHAGYFATKDIFKRKIPGRIIGVSKDTRGKNAFRLTLQTREQHIRREKATSNICTAQALLANMAAMYAVYHGSSGLKDIALRVHSLTAILKSGLEKIGCKVDNKYFFDTIKVNPNNDSLAIIAAADSKNVNFRVNEDGSFGISLDETTSQKDVLEIIEIFNLNKELNFDLSKLISESKMGIPESLMRNEEFLTHDVFKLYQSETKLMRYIKKLESRDLSLTTSMIPLGSCTMKLNAAAELLPITLPEFSNMHPFAPLEQAQGYQELFKSLEKMLCEVTGFDGVSLQPNSGAQGEFAGLLVVKAYHEANGQGQRNVCLIPSSAHGTNPASAALAGMKVVVVKCDDHGNIDVSDLRNKAEANKDQLSVLMVTYPSTHGVFEESIMEICNIIHENGGQVYMDGANLNAQLGLCKPGEFGPDVSHLNLHKTFAIPHGGGGPGIGPIAVKSHLIKFLPNHAVVKMGGEKGVGAISQAPWGSASILPISWMYMKMMGPDGLKLATQVAILNANYIAKKLEGHYEVLYKGVEGLVAHECIIDTRPLKHSAGIEVDDIAKRLMDYGFHAPTMSFPVPGTMMIEPTESESIDELDRFCDAMISIRNEIREIESGKADKENNVLTNAPHTSDMLLSEDWDKPYSRETAAYPAKWIREHKFWPYVGRVDNAYGDRNLICTCPSISEYE